MSGLGRKLSTTEKSTMDIPNLIGADDFIIAIPTFDALDLLANHDGFQSWLTDNSTKQIVIVDVVQMFLAKRMPDDATSQAVNNFLAEFSDRISFRQTEYGKLIETAVNDPDFEFPPETWDLSIISYCKCVTSNLSEKLVLGLIEDEWFEMHAGIDIDAVRLISVSCFLAD
jgi:hypothetical protein